MKKLSLLLPLLFVIAYASAQNVHHRVRIDLKNHSLETVAALGLETDHGIVRPGYYLVNDFLETELELLEQAGIPYRIAIEDVGRWYAEQPQQLEARSGSPCPADEASSPYPTPANYVDGSMGGYLTYDEMLAELARMQTLYPHLISPVTPIDTLLTIEGRPIYWLRVSDKPLEEEPDEPKVLYTALHHAREPNSLSQMIFYLWHLLENYDTDPEVRYLVDHTGLYFIPCLNPDGYLYNEAIEPSGGGLWRKNRREVETGIFGVDLNRNYGYEWGFNDSGSSPNPNSQVYRGDAPFSEPETRAAKFFCEQHDFKIVLNYHAFGNLMIHPWGYNTAPTEEDDIFKGLGEVLTRENGYLLGTAIETVGYIVNGGSDDWMYGGTEQREKAYAYTPEVGPGNFGFWPPASAIDGLNKACLWQNLAAAHLVHYFLEATESTPYYLPDLQGSLSFELKRSGLGEGSATVSVSPASPGLSVDGADQNVALGLLESSTYSFDYTLSPGEEALQVARFALAIDYGDYIYRDTLEKAYINGVPKIAFADTLNELDNWAVNSGWGLTTEDFVSSPTSCADSPFSDYPSGANNTLSLSSPISLQSENAELALLRFQTKWAIEEGYDYAQLLLSTDAANWTPLCGLYTITGVGGFQPEEPLYSGIQETWVQEEIDISEYLGQDIYLQFRLVSDNFIELDGFYFDDLEVLLIEQQPPVGSVQIAPITPELRAYPNPMSGRLFVEAQGLPAEGRAEIRLLNALGQPLQRLSVGNGPALQQLQLATEHLPTGLYVVQLRVDGRPLNSLRLIR